MKNQRRRRRGNEKNGAEGVGFFNFDPLGEQDGGAGVARRVPSHLYLALRRTSIRAKLGQKWYPVSHLQLALRGKTIKVVVRKGCVADRSRARGPGFHLYLATPPAVCTVLPALAARSRSPPRPAPSPLCPRGRPQTRPRSPLRPRRRRRRARADPHYPRPLSLPTPDHPGSAGGSLPPPPDGLRSLACVGSEVRAACGRSCPVTTEQHPRGEVRRRGGNRPDGTWRRARREERRQ
eukprot:gene16465-biopygen3779